MDAIYTEKLTKSYGKARGITELGLRVAEGDFFGFIGPNGAGKSTTIRTLLGLISPTSGTAKVLDLDIRTEKESILSETGYLPSEITFYSGMKVRDTIRLAADLRKTDCSGKAKMLCERLGLDIDKKVDELSLGNRKKVGIVCAVQHSPRLLVLDEPTSGLDPLMQREFFDILEEENKAGTTVFLSSHILSEVQAHCRTAAFIRDGRIVLSDKVEKLERTGAKRVELKGLKDQKILDPLKQEMADIKKNGTHVSFLYSGKLPRLLGILAAAELRDVNITEPTLEEIFMNYYEK